MSVGKIKISPLWAILLASFSSQAEPVFPNVESMLLALEPTAAATAPELNALIIALDAIPTPQLEFDALQTLIPSADGSLRAASEGPMRQMLCVVNDRLLKVTKGESGYSGGDQPVAASADTKDPENAPAKVNAKATTKDQEVAPAKVNAKAEDKRKAQSTNPEAKNKEKDKAKETEIETDKKIVDDKNKDQKQVTLRDATPKEVTNPKDINKGIWIQLLGNNTGQDFSQNVPGYDADVLGLLIGRDHLFTPQFAMGLAGGYTWAKADSRGPSGSFLGIKRFQGSLYAGYNFICPFYLHGVFTVAYNKYDNNRKILVPPFGGVPFVNIAQADFSAWETNAYAETGYVLKIGHFKATPKVMLMYSHFDVGGYIEKDAFGLNLDVKYHKMSFLPLGGGFKLEYENEFDRATVVPEMHVYGFHDFKNSTQTAIAIFTGGGFEFLSQGAEPGKNSIEVGAGLAVHSYLNTAVVIQYDYAARRDYHRNQAFIKVRYEWA